jgi:flagellar basal-body rod protein FlgB
MLQGIEALTNKALSLALDAASLRQQAIATNIANVHTEGFRPLQVDFESQLVAARRALQSRGSVDDAALAQIRPVLFVQAAEEASNAVGLDTQMAALAENSLQYQALLKGLSRQFSILSSAVSDGKK